MLRSGNQPLKSKLATLVTYDYLGKEEKYLMMRRFAQQEGLPEECPT